MSKVTFNNKYSPFYDSLRESVEAYFSNNNIRPTGNFLLYSKALILIPASVILYLILLFTNTGLIGGILLSGLFGFVLACIGFNIMHDACHGSYSTKKWVNNLLGLSLNALGGNSYIWKIKHNIIHHTYPNIDGIDDDIAKAPLIRQCDTQVKLKMHKYQHIYSVIVYALSSFLWVFVMDFVKYFSQKVYKTPMRKMDASEHLVFWGSKVLYIVFYIALPIYFVGVPAFLIGFFSMHVVMGLTLAMVFQLAHVVEDAEFLNAEGLSKVDSEWAVHQVKTTANFATDSKFVSWFVGGLNFQIEHHLFPKISHVHYPAISQIVKDNCEKFNLEYNYYPTVMSAVNSHFRFMKQLGN